MENTMLKKESLISALLGIGLIISFLIIFYLARGYQFDFRKRQIEGTGILVVRSIPDGALIYLNDKKYGATNSSISALSPGRYTLKVEKQGYHHWQREIIIRKELVSEVEALLAPLFPELKPLTYTGVLNPIISPDRQRVLFTAPENGLSSLWLLDIVERPFNLASKPRQLLTDTKEYAYSQSTKQWSPDSREILLKLNTPSLQNKPQITAFTFNVDSKSLQKVGNLEKLEQEWQEETEALQEKNLQNLSQETIARLSTVTNPLWSPNRNAVVYKEITENQVFYKVLDLNPSTAPNNQISPSTTPQSIHYKEYNTYQADKAKFTKLVWYPDSKHLIILEKESKEAEKGKLSLIEADGQNKNEFFSGTIKGDYVFPFSNGTKVAILTTFNPETKVYNLYSISLR
ncbi:hypothetical protein B5M47_00405 [candidate division CPR3 bacterium 4484_211]|uniref:PEGA domain-containing protein n=1 Tax=candidate division CPR3 bacterium 4484_211 TaxID=1968527 RepID=A0A1W9NZI7_UNCC3|nr:MAG: hypothetical protein B5M47_00405 [candidate division CPR3 bacterium 4484_211]